MSERQNSPSSDGIIDVHSRLGPGREGEERTSDTALCEMDACGIQWAWVCAMDPYVAVRNAEGNDFIAAAVRAHGDRFVGCAAVNPWFGPAALRELERAKDMGLKVLFLLPPVQGFQLSDPLVDDLVALAVRSGMPIYAHTGTPICAEPFQLTALARRHPQGTFIMGHMGFADFWYDAAVAAASADNVYLETSLMDGDIISQALAKVGSGRLLFGSDAPISAVDIELEKIKMLDVPSSDLQRILRYNAWELLS